MKKEREEIKKEKGKGWGRCRDFELDQLIGLSLWIICFLASLMDGFPFRRNLEMPLWGQNVCINSKTKQKMNKHLNG